MLISLIAAQAATLTVGPLGYTDISDAVQASAPGDTIRVTAGTYFGNVTLPHFLRIEGEGGATVISQSTVFEVAPGVTARIAGLTLSGGQCVDIGEDGHLDLQDVDGQCGLSVSGAQPAINARTGATLLIRDSTFHGSGFPFGAASLVETQDVVHITNSAFVGGLGATGGALLSKGDLLLYNSTFEQNSAASGGAIAILSGTLRMVGSTFVDNTAEVGGAVFASNSRTIHAWQNQFCGNTAGTSAGAAHLISISESIWANNGFGGNQAGRTSGLQLVDIDRATVMTNTFVLGDDASVEQIGTAPLDLTSNLFAYDEVGARYITVSDRYNLFHDTPTKLDPGPGGGTNFGGDPKIVGLPLPANPSLQDLCAVMPFELEPSSVAIRAGEPSLVSPPQPPPDVGSTGITRDFGDDDNDGTPNRLDCGDSSVGFHQAEICRNGIDDNCDGIIDGGAFAVDDAVWGYLDSDGDGYGTGTGRLHCEVADVVPVDGDCNDDDSDRFPGATELCDQIDNDCDPATPDPGSPGVYFTDADDDGFGDENAPGAYSCDPAAGSLLATDCNDTDGTINPSANEVCNGADENCNDLDDEGLTVDEWFLDSDSDSFGDGPFVEACAAPGADWVLHDGDCDDTESNVYPGAPEICDQTDNDCNLQVDDGLTFQDTWPDSDADGLGDRFAAAVLTCAATFPGRVTNNTDCDDSTASIGLGDLFSVDSDNDGFGSDSADAHPACSQPAGQGPPSDCDDSNDLLHPNTQWYEDVDVDGAGNPDSTPITQCLQPAGRVLDSTDCDDTDNTAQGDTLRWPDGDDDGFGAGTPESVCSNTPGYADNDADCDDTLSTVNPNTAWYPDNDNDGAGAANSTPTTQCLAPTGSWSPNDDDCNDSDPSQVPGAQWYADADDDQIGSGPPTTACAPPTGYVAIDGDCDDQVATVGLPEPRWFDEDGDGYGSGASELRCLQAQWVLVDGDCGPTDPAVNPSTLWFPDLDDDAFGDATMGEASCVAPAGWIADGNDCDDSLDSVNPNGIERCNGLDDDCDGTTDTNAFDATDWYLDSDGDDFGAALFATACDAPANTVSQSGDCDDTENDTYPGAPELCDLRDNDCDPLTPDDATQIPWFADLDDDGIGGAFLILDCSQPAQSSRFQGDCDDGDPAINPGETETCNGIDDNCVNGIDEGFVLIDVFPDLDGDGQGAAGSASVGVCTPGSNDATNDHDCDDEDPTIYLGAVELPGNGIDEDCDGLDGIPPVPTGSTGDTAESAETADTGTSTPIPTPPVPTPPVTPVPTVPVTPGPETPVVPTSVDVGGDEPGTALWFCSATEPAGGLLAVLATGLVLRRRRD